MKKKIFTILVMSCMLCMYGCGGADSTKTNEIGNKTEIEAEAETKMSDEDITSELESIYKEIDEANTYSSDLVALIYDHWNYNGWEAYFDKDIFEKKDRQYNTNGNYSQGSFYGDAKTCFEYRDIIQSNLDDAKMRLKELSPTDETQAYYDAIKELYLNVDSFFSFASDYPEGYSKLTYSQSFSEHQSEYDALVSNIEFEK